mgnify:CR=1 FL=1
MIIRIFRLATLMAIGFLVSSCSGGNESNSLMRMFSGNPERIITVALKDGTAKQLKNSWDKKALSACGSSYTVVNLGSEVSTAGGHNSLSGTIACK